MQARLKSSPPEKYILIFPLKCKPSMYCLLLMLLTTQCVVPGARVLIPTKLPQWVSKMGAGVPGLEWSYMWIEPCIENTNYEKIRIHSTQNNSIL